MLPDEISYSCIRYIAERRCPDGGYCFYRLNEPNPADTFFALDTLRLLGAMPDDPDTACWLLERQGADGRYHSLESSTYVLSSLAALHLRPERDPLPWLSSVVPSARGGGTRPVESTSLLSRPYFFVRLCQSLGVPLPPTVRTAFIDAVRACRHPDGGYGGGPSTLVETYHALAISAALGNLHPDTRTFLARCVHPIYGYLNLPGAVPAYLEHVAAGVGVARLLGVPPADGAGACVRRCQRETGGFARSVFGGTATLKYTWHAVTTLDALECSGKTLSDRTHAETS
ncbi:hypothetical protein E2N92_13055 [Methanofollis formosanus]|uniref:Prenyltransferase alpha-alpha toroid domain-containing protein n=1 Tax=Methanofollis formosanus TaxID=299308 RepID=A0A8G1A486_9EURY|nr:prenyltransferase/squalene oxidase repeat-containing protein [Methanofollis formosanus]QYZ80290.1 hypothetical protein E2N92_13055 [Methanofollis formosanus]